MPRSTVKDQRQQELINATIDSIARRGLTETTITHISKGAGLSRGIINFYFDSKEKLMRGVLAHLLEEYQQRWQQAQLKAEIAPDKQLEAIIRAHFDRRICSPKRLNVLSAFWGHAASHEPYRKQFAESDAALIAAIAKELDRPDAEAFALQLHALIRGLWLRYLLAPQDNDREALAEEALTFIRGQAALKVVADNPQIVKKARVRKTPSAGQQMDIEDLFANG